LTLAPIELASPVLALIEVISLQEDLPAQEVSLLLRANQASKLQRRKIASDAKTMKRKQRIPQLRRKRNKVRPSTFLPILIG